MRLAGLVASTLLISCTFLTGCFGSGRYSFELAGVAGKGGSVTDAGNPAIRPVTIEIGPLPNASITSLAFCVSGAKVYPTDGSPAVDATIDVADAQVSASGNNTPIGRASLRAGKTYDRVELLLRPGCSTLASVRLTNGLGTFSAQEPVVAVFKGVLASDASAVVRLALGELVASLASVQADAQVKPAVEGASGQIIPIAPVSFVQSQTGSALTGATSLLTAPFTSPILAGSRIVCSFWASSSPSGMTDSHGGNYVSIRTVQSGNHFVGTFISDAPDPGGGGFAVSATILPASDTSFLSCAEYSGLSSMPNSLPIGWSAAASSPDPPVSTTISTTSPNQLLYRVLGFEGPGEYLTSGLTQRSSVGTLRTHDLFMPEAGSVLPTFSGVGTAGEWAAVSLSLKGN